MRGMLLSLNFLSYSLGMFSTIFYGLSKSAKEDFSEPIHINIKFIIYSIIIASVFSYFYGFLFRKIKGNYDGSKF